MPVVNKDGKVIGVTQVLNKRGGPFTAEDEARLKAFTAQISIALENAKLFDDVQNMKNYNESMLESMSNGVHHARRGRRDRHLQRRRRCASSRRRRGAACCTRRSRTFFTGDNAWMLEQSTKVEADREARKC